MAGIDEAYVGATRAAYQAALKDYYLPSIIVTFNSSTVLYYRAQKTSEPVVGGTIQLLLNTKRSEGYGSIRYGGRIPDPDRQGYTRMQFPIRYHYARIKVPGPLMAETRDPAGAWGEVVDLEVNGVTRDEKNDINRQLFNDGSGRLAVVTDASNQASGILQIREVFDLADQAPDVMTVRDGTMVAIVDASASTTSPIAAGMFIDMTGGVRQGIVGNSDPQAKTITIYPIDTSTGGPQGTPYTLAGIAAGDAIVRVHVRDNTVRSSATLLDECAYRHSTAPATDEGASAREMMGLAGMVSANDVFCGYNLGAVTTTGLQNISVAAGNPFWKAFIIDNGAVVQPLDLNDMQRCVDAQERIGQSYTTIIVTSYGGRRAYLRTFAAERRYPDVMDLDGGFKALSFNGLPLVPEKDCTAGRFYFLDETTLLIARMSEWFWLARDNAVLHRLDDYDAWQATLAYYAEYCLRKRNALAGLFGVQEA